MPMTAEIAALTVEVRDLNETVKGEREAKKWALRVVAGVLVLVVGFGWWGIWQSGERIDDVIAARGEARKVACNDDNENAEADRLQASTSAESARAFAALLLGDREIDDQIQAALDVFNQDVVAPFEHLADAETGPYKPRDCSDDGIAAYYEGGKP